MQRRESNCIRECLLRKSFILQLSTTDYNQKLYFWYFCESQTLHKSSNTSTNYHYKISNNTTNYNKLKRVSTRNLLHTLACNPGTLNTSRYKLVEVNYKQIFVCVNSEEEKKTICLKQKRRKEKKSIPGKNQVGHQKIHA